jgi:hypothetical protein
MAWARVYRSFEEEAEADREYYASFSPDERVGMIADLLRDWDEINGMVQADNRDFADLFRLLNSHGVRYVIVGAYAFAFHVKPRYTKDLDLFVEPTTENARRLLATLEDFGFASLGLTLESFAEGQIVALGVEPKRIDFITRIASVTFAEAWETRLPGQYMSIPVHYLGREALIRNKTAAARPQDLADLAALR